MTIDATVTHLKGSWQIVNGKVTEDEISRRIRSLIENDLQKIAISNDGWEALYKDPKDGRYWELYHLEGESQGGGPIALRAVNLDQVSRKYTI